MATATVTVLFTDLVGSTALLSRVGDQAAEELRREHFTLLREAVEQHGGREVKNLGDGLMVVFSSAADAVAAGVAMQQAFARRNRRAAEPLDIRVGVALGDAEVAEDDYFGVPVVQAARLCSAAEGGEVLCTEVVRLLSGSRAGATFEAVGELELKGLDEPVATARVVWSLPDEESGDGERPPLPGRLAALRVDGFVGRRAEHEVLVEAWKTASAEAERRVVLLEGEPGIGKTTLTARFAHQVHDEGALVVYGRSDEDLGIPYQPWIEALGQLVEAAPADVLADHVADRGAHLARLVPQLTRRTGHEVAAASDEESERYALFACVVDLLERLSSEVPVLVVLDDLHWADRQSLQLLRHLVTAGRPLRVLILGTFRDTDVGAGDPMTELLAALHREAGTERIGLRGLSDVDLLELLEQVAGHEMDDRGIALRDAVLAETAGNPFFVGEIIRHLAESGAIYQNDEGRWVGDLDVATVGLPVSVKEVVGRRLASLGEDAERLLAQAAVIGRDFDVDLLAAVADVDEDDAIDLCDRAVAAAVLQTTDRIGWYTFAHALIGHTLYEGLSPTRRARAHRKVAEAIEQLEGDDPGARAGELAHHWAQAVQPADLDKAVRYARLAGDRALEQLAPDDAVGWYTQALELLERGGPADRHRRAELLLGLGIAQRQGGQPEHRESLLEAAHLADEADDVDLLVCAALANSRGWQSNTGHVDEVRLAVVELALERLGDADSADRARLLATAAVERYFRDDLEDRMALAEQAVAVARRTGDPLALAAVLNHAAMAVRAPSTLEQRTAWVDEACELADRTDDPSLRWGAHDQRMLCALERGDLAGIRHHDAKALEASDRSPEPSRRWTDAFHAVWQAALRGDLAETEALADAALTLGLEQGQPDALTIYGAQLAHIRTYGGRLHELIPAMEEALAAAPTLTSYPAAIANAHARGGDLDRAAALLDEAYAGGFPARDDGSLKTALAAWAETAVLVGHQGAAEALRERMLPFHDQIVSAHVDVLPAVALYLGRVDHLLGRLDDADRWLAEADAIHRGLESPLLVAWSDVAWAGVLVDRDRGDDRARGRAMARSALDVAIAQGYGYIEEDARAVLACA